MTSSVPPIRQMVGAVHGDEPGLKRHQQMERLIGQVKVVAVVAVNKPNVRLGSSAVVGRSLKVSCAQPDLDQYCRMAKWTIRRAMPEDAAALATCVEAAYAGYRQHIDDLPPVSEGIAGDINANSVWVAVLDQRVVGGLVLVLRDDVAMLANVAVDPNCAGMGIGRGLIEHAETACRRLRKKKLRLSTHVAMPENISLYEHLGWKETGRSGNKVHMAKVL